MIDREDIGSWLSGPQFDYEADDYPGKRLGLPQKGPGSIAGYGRRFLALIIDWALCTMLAAFLFDSHFLAAPLIFLVENVVLVGTLGYTVGHRLTNIQVFQRQGGWAGPWKGVVRSVLLSLVIPAVFFDQDRRGLHDLAAGTILVVRPTDAGPTDAGPTGAGD